MHDLIVIGGGPGGYPAAIRAARRGLSVCLVEEREMGGVCLNRGCIPTKALFHAAREVEPLSGGGIEKTVSFSWPAVLASIRTDVVMRMRAGINFLLKQNGIETVAGRGVLRGPGAVEVAGRLLEAKNVIVATGSSPAVPAAFADDPRVLTSDDLWTLESLPASVAVVGGGAIGCEFASILRTFGAAVTLYEMCETLLPLEDPETVGVLAGSFRKRGIAVKTGTRINSLSEIPEEKILVAVGRRPNTAGLAEAGVTLERGAAAADAGLRTNIPGVYAVGDVNGRHLYAYVATKEGEIAAANCAGGSAAMEYEHIPSAVFTDPEIGSCGVSERRARELDLPVKIGKFPYQALGKAHAERRTTGFFKIVAHAETDRVLGIHIVGERATELASLASVAIAKQATGRDLAETLYCHPSFAEGIMEAAGDLDGACIHLPPKKK